MKSNNRDSGGSAANFPRLRGDAGDSQLDRTLDAFHRAAVNNINTLFDRIDRAALERAALALAEARHVLVVGMLSADSFAGYLHHVAAMRFRNWHLVDWRDGRSSPLVAALSPADVVVGIAVEPYAADAVEIARHASDVGARVVGITDRRLSPLAACANDVLLFPVRRPSVFKSHVGATALVETLVDMVAARCGGAAGESAGKPAQDGRAIAAHRQE